MSAARRIEEPAPLPGSDEPDLSPAAALRERIDRPVERAAQITRKTMQWFPVRVWRHFTRHNGFLLSAGLSYQSLFAIFAVLYVAFASFGLWVGDSSESVDHLFRMINSYIPGLVSNDGLVHPDAAREIVEGTSTGTIAVTGAVALVAAIWTAIGFITYARRAVRDIFGLPFDGRNFLLLKARDLLAATIFGIALIVGWMLGQLSAWAIDLVFTAMHVEVVHWPQNLTGRAIALVVAFIVNTTALAALYRFLAGTSLGWRRLLPGSMIAGIGVAVLQLGTGLLVRYTPSNQLLAAFAVLFGFLLWFRLVGVVILFSAAWISVSADDRDIPLMELSDSQRAAAEHEALIIAAGVVLRRAQESRDSAPWWLLPRERRNVAQAAERLTELEETAPQRAPEPIRVLDL